MIETKNAVKKMLTSYEFASCKNYIAAAAISVMACPAAAFATQGTMDSMFGSLIGIVCRIFFYIGTILLVWSIGQLVMAFRNDDADSKQRAIQVFVVSVLLMSVGTIYTAVTSGIDGHIEMNNKINI